MIKIILAIVIGLGIGGAVGFFAGTDRTEKIHKEILRTEQDAWTQQLNECKEQVTKIEEESKAITAELKLNESRPNFVSSAMLMAPEFIPPDLEALNSDKNGDIKLSWSPVKGAKQYVVTVEDKDGKSLSTTEVEGETSMFLNRVAHSVQLSEAEYFVRIASVNGLDQVGPQGAPKPVHFASQSFKSSKKAKTKKRK